MKSINARIIALMGAIETRKMEQGVLADDLSKSLWAMGAELAALDAAGLAAEAEALGITPENVQEMARTYARRSVKL